MRSGAELLAATKPFATEDRGTTWRLLAEVMLVWAACMTAILLVPWCAAKLAMAVVTGLVQIRIFIFYHDYLHGAILRKSRAAEIIMWLVGFYMLAVKSVWRETHNFHHKNNAKIIGSSIGSFPVLTVGMYRGLDPFTRLKYRFARHPLTIFLGYVPVFLIGMSLQPFRRNAKKHWQAPLALLVHFLGFAAAIYFLGLVTALCFLIVPTCVTLGAGSYLFYAQHNFPDIQLKGRRDWDYTFAALRSSSMFDMPGLMHWATGNIGYHHVHHLNHRIPFYRLPEAMAAIEELQHPGRTSWHVRDIKACLSLAVWDPDQQRMLTYSEVRY